jgi:hypothetical protein
VEGLLIVTSWIDTLQTELGLKGVSQVWGNRPAWYFWVSQAPGVYHLEFADAAICVVEGHTLYQADFILKCYPYPHHELLKTFSYIERELVQSHFFDKTHSPAFEYQEQIPPDLFNVAALTFTADPEDRIAHFGFETFDVMRTFHLHETVRYYPELDKYRTWEAGRVDRNLPAFRISYPFFQLMLCLFSHAIKRTPARIQLSKLKGFEFAMEGKEVRFIPSKDVQGLRYGIWYHPSTVSEFFTQDKMASFAANDTEAVLYDRTFNCGHFQPSEAETALPAPLDERWWTLAHTRYDSRLASSCGCH